MPHPRRTPLSLCPDHDPDDDGLRFPHRLQRAPNRPASLLVARTLFRVRAFSCRPRPAFEIARRRDRRSRRSPCRPSAHPARKAGGCGQGRSDRRSWIIFRMELDRRPRLFRFSLALVAELLLCASLNFFDDWTLEEMPVKFVTIALLCDIAYFAAGSSFHTQLSVRAQPRTFR